MNVHIKVIIPAYNSVKWIRKTLQSVSSQTYRNFNVCIIDDASTEEGQREIIQEYSQKYGWKSIFREKNQGALANIVDGIKYLEPADEDVILLLDGDDWLYNKSVFAKIANAYANEPVHMTYGQFITYPRWQAGLCRPLTEELLMKKNFREIPFAFSHLRTFKHKVWKRIDEKDLKDCEGNYFKTAWDLAIMYPLLEMTGGESCKFINDYLYVYNMDNPLNDCIAHKKLQADTAVYIREKKPYPRIFDAKCRCYKPSSLQNLRNHWISIYKKIITPRVYQLAAKKLLKKFRVTINEV
jgi:glycosyltransferase involved in cell wall biosynthesis